MSNSWRSLPFKAFISVIMAVVLACGLLPAFAFAEQPSDVESSVEPGTANPAVTQKEINSAEKEPAVDVSAGDGDAEPDSGSQDFTGDDTDRSAGLSVALEETDVLQPQAVESNSEGDESQAVAQGVSSAATILGRAHVQDIGWQDWVDQGSFFGTTGMSKRVEALELKINSTGYADSSIIYESHVQDIGWQSPVSNGDLSGTTGRCLRVEAVKISLSGSITDDYDVYYRVHVSDIGWMGWTKNGASAGTQGMCARAEAYEVRLIEKGQAAPVDDGAIKASFMIGTGYSAMGHVQDIGNMPVMGNGDIIGTMGQGLRLEALSLRIGADRGSIRYQAHVQDIGWQHWMADGQLAGTTGESKRMEAVKIELTGAIAGEYNVYYRVHIAELGWLDWACNGEEAGSVGYGLRIEALQMKFVPKEDAAPGSTDRPSVKTYEVSSNDELNKKITMIIDTVTGTNIRKCFEYSMTYGYRAKELYPSYDKWTEDYTFDLLNTGFGNCYSYATLFYYLAKACGFDGEVVSGQITQRNGSITAHGWVELDYYGTTYVCDPDLEKELAYNGYLITYDNAPLKYVKIA